MAKEKTESEDGSLTAAQQRVRDGDTAALETWAAEVEAAGDAEMADIIRQLPGLRDYIAESLVPERARYPEVGVTLYYNLERRWSYWYLGDCDIDESTEQHPKHWPRRMGQLLLNWNALHPGVEWLARELGLPRVKRYSRIPPATKETADSASLSTGGHLSPTEPGHVVVLLAMAPSLRGKKGTRRKAADPE